MKRFKKILQLVKERTGDAVDAAGCPAWWHPVRVAARIPESAGAETLLVALLHASVDDGLVTPEELEQIAESRPVADAVLFLTKPKEKVPFLDRVRRTAVEGTLEAIVVHYADLVDRMSPEYIDMLPPERRVVRERNASALSVMESEIRYRSRQAGRSVMFTVLTSVLSDIARGAQDRDVLERVKGWLGADDWQVYREKYGIKRLPRRKA